MFVPDKKVYFLPPLYVLFINYKLLEINTGYSTVKKKLI